MWLTRAGGRSVFVSFGVPVLAVVYVRDCVFDQILSIKGTENFTEIRNVFCFVLFFKI